MNKILYIILFSFIVSNCSFKPVVKHHGVPFLEKKQTKLIVNKSNTNDIKKILGKSHYLIKASESFYHEVTPQCFEMTMKRSTILDTAEIKKNLEAFNAK